MKPGPKLDELIEEKIFGHKKIGLLDDPSSYGLNPLIKKWLWSGKDIALCQCTPQYSTIIESAFNIIEKLGYRNFSMHNDVGYSGREKTPGKGWMVLFHIEGGPMAYTFGESAPHAICLAALRAKGIEIE